MRTNMVQYQYNSREVIFIRISYVILRDVSGTFALLMPKGGFG